MIYKVICTHKIVDRIRNPLIIAWVHDLTFDLSFAYRVYTHIRAEARHQQGRYTHQSALQRPVVVILEAFSSAWTGW